MRCLRWLAAAWLVIGTCLAIKSASDGGGLTRTARGDEPAKAPDKPAAGTDAQADDAASRPVPRILMLTQSAGFRHSSVTRKEGQLSPAERTMTDLAASSKVFRVDCTQDAAADFTKEKLAQHDIVFFYTTSSTFPPFVSLLPIPPETLDYFFNDWLKQPGHGWIGVHSAADTFHENAAYKDMLGAEFRASPWGNGSLVTVTVHDTKHPAMKPWGDEFEIKDEIYAFKNWHPENVHVLMSLNMAKCEKKEPYHVPVAWCRNYGQGKVFYMSLGHDESVWANPKYQESLLGAIKWELNLEPGDATPNPEVSQDQQAKAEADFAAGKK